MARAFPSRQVRCATLFYVSGRHGGIEAHEKAALSTQVPFWSTRYSLNFSAKNIAGSGKMAGTAP